MQKTKEESEKKKMSLLEEIIDVAIVSSRVMSTVVNNMLVLTNEIKSIKESLSTLTKALHVHQIAISELMENLTQDSIRENFEDVGQIKNARKDKPN